MSEETTTDRLAEIEGQADDIAQATVIPGPEYGADEVPQTSECVQCGTQIEGPRIMWKYCNGCVKENEQ